MELQGTGRKKVCIIILSFIAVCNIYVRNNALLFPSGNWNAVTEAENSEAYLFNLIDLNSPLTLFLFLWLQSWLFQIVLVFRSLPLPRLFKLGQKWALTEHPARWVDYWNNTKYKSASSHIGRQFKAKQKSTARLKRRRRNETNQLGHHIIITIHLFLCFLWRSLKTITAKNKYV